MRFGAGSLLFAAALLLAGCGPAAQSGGEKDSSGGQAQEAPGGETSAVSGASGRVGPEERPSPAAEQKEESAPAAPAERPEETPEPPAEQRPVSLYEWEQGLFSEPVSLETLPVTVSIPVPNSNNEGDMKFSFVWKFPESAWKVEPVEAVVDVPAGDTKEVSFRLEPATPSFPFPVPRLSVSVVSGGRETASFSRPLAVDFIRSVRAVELPVPPKVDGTLDPEWSAAGKATGFVLDDGSYIANPPTVVYAARDGDNLYFAFICYEPDPASIRTGSASKRDDPVWKDDSVEMFLAAPSGDGSYYHLLVSAAGILQDEKNRGEAWDGKWKAAVKVERDAKRWIVEAAVPAADLGLKDLSSVKELRVNFARNRHAGNGQTSVWNCTFGSFHKPRLFGRLILQREE